ncbi:MAG: hypothetical protein HZC29_08825, partial [Thaumarchaeota archaeon]|nr:hypothetical protein [Nitrososphaerota archaeon]
MEINFIVGKRELDVGTEYFIISENMKTEQEAQQLKDKIRKALEHYNTWKDVNGRKTNSIEKIMEMTNPLEQLIEIARLLGYGDGKSSMTHIVDTPMEIELTKTLNECKQEILQNQHTDECRKAIELYNKIKSTPESATKESMLEHYQWLDDIGARLLSNRIEELKSQLQQANQKLEKI